MEIKGKIIQVLPLQTGEGKNGVWKKQEFILENTESQYPRKVCISAWGDKFGADTFTVGNDVNVFIDVESREYNGRWYTDVKAWKIENLGGSSSSINENSAPSQPQSVPSFTPVAEELSGGDDLPF